MSLLFILLFKGGLGVGGGFGALIVAGLLIYCIYLKERGGDVGCGALLLLPLMPVIWLVSLFVELDKKGIEKELEYTAMPYSGPFSLLLKVLVILSAIAVWIMVIVLMDTYDVSSWWLVLWGVMMPLVFINLYLLWQNVFFVRLGGLRDRTATAVCVVVVLLIILFWVFATPAFNHYTSLDYLKGYWQRKYGLI